MLYRTPLPFQNHYEAALLDNLRFLWSPLAAGQLQPLAYYRVNIQSTEWTRVLTVYRPELTPLPLEVQQGCFPPKEAAYCGVSVHFAFGEKASNTHCGSAVVSGIVPSPPWAPRRLFKFKPVGGSLKYYWVRLGEVTLGILVLMLTEVRSESRRLEAQENC